MQKNELEELYDAGEALLLEIRERICALPLLQEKAERFGFALAELRGRIEAEKTMELFIQRESLWMEKSKETNEIIQLSNDVFLQSEYDEKQNSQGYFISLTVSEIMSCYKKVNNFDCDKNKAEEILRYIVANYDKKIGLERYCENICQQMIDDNLLALSALSFI